MSKPESARLWIKVILPGSGQLGPGKIELLRRIKEHRSMSAAARSMDMSYRRAWLLVDELNHLFKQPVVEKWHGGIAKGGATLTEFGETVVRRYGELLERSHEVNLHLLRELAKSARRG
jgi:molybdate transport system regulatory protein